MNAPLPPTVADPATLRNRHVTRLPTPTELRHRLPLAPDQARQVMFQRQQVRDVLCGRDSRMLVIVGPCSIHDVDAALEYGQRLAALAPLVSDRLLLVMRAYVEKPRTTVGWKGLAYDPGLNGSHDLAGGLALSRRLMLDLLALGLPLASELLQPLVAGYLDDLLAWGAIGARTSESQVHRELVSGLDFPVGFKNGTDGGVAIACDAMRAASRAHHHFGVDEDGRIAWITTAGNPDTHLVLRGGHAGPNHDARSVADASRQLQRQAVVPRLVVDCSHANSGKDPARQPEVLADVLEQRLAGTSMLRGVMLESHLEAGQQQSEGVLRYGVSITDGCLGWNDTEQLLKNAAARLRHG